MVQDKTTTALVLEDEMFIAMDIEEVLADAGVTKILSFPACAQAIDYLRTNTPDVAVIDFHLHGVTCLPVAEILAERKVPTVIHSGNHYEEGYHGIFFKRFPWVMKPSSATELADALELARLGVGEAKLEN